MPKSYAGADDIEKFSTFLQGSLRWMKTVRMVGPEYDDDRVIIMGQMLTGIALEWYNQVVESPHRVQVNWTFEELMCAIFQRFVHKANSQQAARRFDSIEYDASQGVSHLAMTIRKWGSRMTEMPTDYTNARKFMRKLPSTIRSRITSVATMTAETHSFDELVRTAIVFENAMLEDKYYRDRYVSDKSSNDERKGSTKDRSRKGSDRNRTVTGKGDKGNEPQSNSLYRPFQRRRDRFAFKRTGDRRNDRERRPTERKDEAPKEREVRREADRKGKNVDKSHIKCFKCGRMGHFATDPECPQFQRPAIRRLAEAEEPLDNVDDVDKTVEEVVESYSVRTENKEEPSSEEDRVYGDQYESEDEYDYRNEEYSSDEEQSSRDDSATEEIVESLRAMRLVESVDVASEDEVMVMENDREEIPSELSTDSMPSLMTVEDFDIEDEGFDDHESSDEDRRREVVAATNATLRGEVVRLHRYIRLMERDLADWVSDVHGLRDRLEGLEMELGSLNIANESLRRVEGEYRDEIRLLIQLAESELTTQQRSEVAAHSRHRESVREQMREAEINWMMSNRQTPAHTPNEVPTTSEDRHRIAGLTESQPVTRQAVERLAVLTTNDREYRSSMKRRDPDNGRPLRDLKCITAYVTMNGVKALALFDSGCSIDTISPEFAKIANLSPFKLDKPIPLQLGCVGSRSSINFGVRTKVLLGNRTSEVYLDVANIDHYDVILGIPFMVQWGITLDFKADVLRFEDQEIPSLRTSEEGRSQLEKPMRPKQKTAVKYEWAESSKKQE